MSFKIKVSTPDTLFSLASDVYFNKLHNKDGHIKPLIKFLLFSYINNKKIATLKYKWVYQKQKQHRLRYIISVIYNKENNPIGCLVIDSFYTNIFIKQEYRRKGFATRLFQETALVYNLEYKILNTGHTIAAKKLKSKLGIPDLIRDLNQQTKLVRGNNVSANASNCNDPRPSFKASL